MSFKTYKYRIYPTKAQAANLENQFAMCRHLYNWALSERKEAYLEKGNTITYKQQQNALPNLKQKKPWFKNVHSQVLQDVLRRLDRAYLNFYRRAQQGGGVAFPKYKKHGQWNSITYPQYKFRPGPVIRVPKVGSLKVKYHRPLPEADEVRILTVTKEFGKWFACFSVVHHPADAALRNVSEFRDNIEVGVIDLVEAFDAYVEQTPRYRHLIKRCERLKEKVRSTRKHSNVWEQRQKAIEKVRFRLKYRLMDFLHKQANRFLLESNMILVEEFDRGVLERPVYFGSKRRTSHQSNRRTNTAKRKLNDVGWYMFVQILRYKAEAQKKQILIVPHQHITGICENCGAFFRKADSSAEMYGWCGCPLELVEHASMNDLRIGLDTPAVQAAYMLGV